MNKMIIINCPPWGVFMPPLGVAYLSRYLRSRNKQIEVYDLNIQLYNKADSNQKKYWQLDRFFNLHLN